MKNNKYIFIWLALILSACCELKGPYPIAAVLVTYENIDSSQSLQAYLTERNSFSNIKDTILLGELNELNNFSIVIEFDEDASNYILFIEETDYMDTISDIYYYRSEKNCKETIEDFRYQFNGQLKTSNRQIIY